MTILSLADYLAGDTDDDRSVAVEDYEPWDAAAENKSWLDDDQRARRRDDK